MQVHPCPHLGVLMTPHLLCENIGAAILIPSLIHAGETMHGCSESYFGLEVCLELLYIGGGGLSWELLWDILEMNACRSTRSIPKLQGKIDPV